MNRIEIGVGVAIGAVIFFIWQGVNLMPVFFLAGLVGIMYYMVNVRGGKSFAVIGSNKNEEKMISFDEIGGQDVAKKELCEALEFIRDVEKIKSLGIRPLKGLLLNGPPGTGKTLLAKAAAQYIDSAFVLPVFYHRHLSLMWSLVIIDLRYLSRHSPVKPFLAATCIA